MPITPILTFPSQTSPLSSRLCISIPTWLLRYNTSVRPEGAHDLHRPGPCLLSQGVVLSSLILRPRGGFETLFLLVLPPLVPSTLAILLSLRSTHLCTRAPLLVQFNTASCLLSLGAPPHCNHNELRNMHVSSSRLAGENLSLTYCCLQRNNHTLPAPWPRLEAASPGALGSSLPHWLSGDRSHPSGGDTPTNGATCQGLPPAQPQAPAQLLTLCDPLLPLRALGCLVTAAARSQVTSPRPSLTLETEPDLPVPHSRSTQFLLLEIIALCSLLNKDLVRVCLAH